jgi:hypothetical protein
MRNTDKERQKILDFLGLVDPKKYQETGVRLRQPGTGTWFTEGQEFNDWYSTKHAKLWLYGIRKCPLHCPINVIRSSKSERLTMVE